MSHSWPTLGRHLKINVPFGLILSAGLLLAKPSSGREHAAIQTELELMLIQRKQSFVFHAIL